MQIKAHWDWPDNTNRKEDKDINASMTDPIYVQEKIEIFDHMPSIVAIFVMYEFDVNCHTQSS